MNKKILFIPDVHGRDFWKDAITKIDEFEKVVFCGDYLDPYPSEGISFEQAIDNLNELISWKKDYMDKIILLLGNHDMGYLDKNINTHRMNYKHAPEVKKFFEENLDLFDIAWETEINGKRYFFSHSGVKKDWLVMYRGILDCEDSDHLPDANFFNNLLHCNEGEQKDKFFYAISACSRYRGCFESTGSIIWSDVREWIGPKKTELKEFDDVMFIFGHSQLESGTIVTDYFADLDVRRPFIIGDDGIIYEFDMTPVEVIKLNPMTDELKNQIEEERKKELELLSKFFL